jgi:ATP/maltotriose-dependent transcriptional regulator MalT
VATVAHAPDLVERDRELAVLHALLADAVAGRGRVALIEGPAGIGKSRLLGELREAAARDGIPVLAARASELEREFPFGVVRQLLEAPLAAAAAPERLLAGAAAPAGPIFAAVGDEAATTGGDGGSAALHGLFWLTLNLARALAALGGLVRRSRRPADAREPLRQALELADACGADALAESVRTELYAAGARPRTAALSGARSLTASERRVAELAAGGATNREIAQALFVTPKTVEVHLSSAYRKLGIASRRDLPGVLASQT